MKIHALSAVLVLTAATVAFAQQAAAPQLEAPYLCGGITVTIHRCGNVGGQDVCMYRVDIPGGQSVEVNKPREQVMAQLKACKLQPATAPKPGQPLNPAYLSEMPSADRVMKAMKTSDPRETVLRQMGAFYQLSEIISTLSGPREIRGYMPDELRILTEYSKAQYEIGLAADKAFPGPYGTEKTLSGNTPYRYSRNDPRFGYKGIPVWQTFLSEGMHNQFAKIIGADNAKYEAKVAEQKRDAAAALAANSAPVNAPGGGAQSGGMRNDPGSVAARRCVEAGRSEMECVGEGLKTGLNDMFGGVVGGALGSEIPSATSGYTGLRMSGDFTAAGIWILISDSGAVVKCGGLMPESHQYTVERAGDRMLVKIDNAPKPITATFRADGKLVGPGAIEVAGRVVVGSSSVGGGSSGGYEAHTETTTQERQIAAADVANHSADEVHQNGQEYSVSEQHTTTTYEQTAPTARRVEVRTAPKTERCNVGVLPGTPQKGLVAGLSEILDPSAPKSAGKPFGVRMAGNYAGAGGLNIEFRSDSATVECGEAHVAMGYEVENVSGQVQVTINNPTGSFTILLRPDGNLEGSGTVMVAGRVVTGSQGDQIAYAPRKASCAVGMLAPKR
ncbi:MAG: hypothetical protein ABLT11_05555 [Candidatus Acidiferrum sp.]